jgi:hypothetical protein
MEPMTAARALVRFGFAAAGLIIAGLSIAHVPVEARDPLRIVPLVSPAATPAGEPQLSVSNRGVLLSWIERAGSQATLKFAERTGSGWSAPRVVASGGDWFVNWADVPSVVRLANGTLAAHWLQKSGPGTYAYDVRLSHSTDDGRTWSPSFLPHHDRTKTEHGFASLFAMPAGGLGLVWLDGRAMGSGTGADQGAMTLRSAAFDRAWRQTADLVVDPRVCECCPTSAAVTSEGPIVAFRNRTADEIRDIYISRLEGERWTEPVPVHNDGWRIAACPVNGPMLSARGRDVAIAWFTMKGGQGQVFAAFSTDAGRSFGTPFRVDEAGALGRVDIELLPDGAGVVSWIEHSGGQAEFRLRRIERSGARGDAVTIAPVSATRTSGYPRMAWDGRELVFAWVEISRGAPGLADGTRRVLTAVARHPGGL